MGCAEGCPDHHDAPCGGEKRAEDDADSEVASRKPCAAELTGKAGGKQSACLCVLDIPPLDQNGQKRTEHYGCYSSYYEVEEYWRERSCTLVVLLVRLIQLWSGLLQCASARANSELV
jgi:hypothetical protein